MTADKIESVTAHEVINTFTSASTEDGYNPDANIRIYISSEKGKDISTFNPSEKEVLYKSNTIFRICNHVEKNGIHYFLMEEKNVR